MAYDSWFACVRGCGRRYSIYEVVYRCEDCGGLLYVQHDLEALKDHSADEWKRFMPRLSRCRLCLDMSHVVHWGYDPVQAVHDYKDRLAYVHLHDHKNGRNVELGEGPMCDYPAFLRALEDIGYGHWITVCPGQSRRPEAEQMRINRDYLKGIGY